MRDDADQAAGACLIPPLRGRDGASGGDAAITRVLAPYLNPRRFVAGERLWLQGDHAGLLVLLERGRVKAVREQPGGRSSLLYIFTPGDLFGFLPFVDGSPYPATAIALEEVSARVMTRAALAGAVAAEPEVSIALLAALGARLRDAFAHIGELSERRAVVRVAAALIRLIPPSSGSASPSSAVLTTVTIPEPAYVFAEEAGVTPETFSRELKRLSAAGVLHRLGSRRWQILSRARLQAIATGVDDLLRSL